MWREVQIVFREAYDRIMAAVVSLLPGLLAMAAIIAVAVLVALAARWILQRSLARLDRRARALGITAGPEQTMQHPPSSVVARGAFWFVVLVGVALGLDVFGASTTSALGLGLLGLLPRLLVAAIVFLVGIGAARVLERSVLIGAVNLQLHSARLLATGVKWFMLVFATALALQHLGVGGPIVTIAFSVVLGGIVLALALAVGLGSRRAVGRAIARRLDGERRTRREDRPVQHL